MQQKLYDLKKDGTFNAEVTNEILSARLAELEHAVIPGFYGATEDGTVVTFSRGGSDVTGSLVAQAVQADLYENWTDVSGFLIADPRIVKIQNLSKPSHIKNFVSFPTWEPAYSTRMRSSL